jgi:hypothetical protein
MESTLSPEEFRVLNRKFIEHLNTFEADSELKLDENYFSAHEVLADYKVYEMYRFLTVEMRTDDDGGPSVLMIHCNAHDIGDIEFAAWTFDTTTTVWIDQGWN